MREFLLHLQAVFRSLLRGPAMWIHVICVFIDCSSEFSSYRVDDTHDKGFEFPLRDVRDHSSRSLNKFK